MKVIFKTLKIIISFLLCITFVFATEKFSIILIPDTQYYSLRDPETYRKQMQWIADSSEAKNIKFSIHLGDITHTNSTAEWEAANIAHNILDENNIPYSIIPGNHDNVGKGKVRNTDLYNKYFSVNRYKNKPWYGGSFGKTNDSNYWLFEVDQLKFMVLCLEFAPRKEVLAWADSLLLNYSDRRIIVATHCYQTHGSDHCTTCGTGYNIAGSAGNTIWNEFVRRHSNIFMVVSGHVGDSEYYLRKGNNGNFVHEILTDYQFEQRDGVNHGNGWMRILEFEPDNNKVNVKVFTVLDDVVFFNQDDYSPIPTLSDHKYSFDYEMTQPIAGKYLRLYNGFNDIAIYPDDIGTQHNPEIAMNEEGNFFTVWQDSSIEYGQQIACRGFDISGVPLFNRIMMNNKNGSFPENPAIAVNNKMALLVWEESSKYIKASGFDLSGKPIFENLIVNPDDGINKNPAVVIAEDGSFIVVWEYSITNGPDNDIVMRCYNADGSEKFPARLINTQSAGSRKNPAIAMNNNGNFLIVWQDDADKNLQYVINGVSFNSEYNEVFAEKRLNTSATGNHCNPKVGINDNQQCVVVWEDDRNNDGFFQISGSTFNLNGNFLNKDITICTKTTGQQTNPDVSITQNGDFIAVFQDDNDNNGYYQIYGTEFSINGIRKGTSTFTVNENASGQQFKPVTAMFDPTRFVVLWEDDMNKNGKYEILAKGYDYGDTYITQLTENSDNVISNFSLYQNYPNPFNPVTNIRFSVHKPGKVDLIVYNIQGKRITSLINAYLETGNYITKWNASDHPSGVYIYKMTIDNCVQSGKMMLIK